MSKSIISVEGIGKAYRLGAEAPRHATFRDAILAACSAPLRRLREMGEPASEHDAFWALRDVSFEIGRGQVVGIVGRNGAGKSTLLKVLSRITEPTEGLVRLRGRVASLLEVGTGFHPELSGRENIFLNGSILGMRKAEIDRKFDEIVAFAEVDRFLDTPVKRYSSGMYVRLAFAVAAHLEPEILIVDEVLAVGDAQFQKKCLGKMKSVASGEGRTVLFVSHNMAAVRQLCSRALLMRKGRLTRNGTADEVVSDHLGNDGGGQIRGTISEHGIELMDADLIETSSGRETTQPLLNGDYRLEVRVRAHRALSDACVVMRVYDDMGTLVSTLCTPEEGVDPFPLSDAVRVTFPLPRLQLLPGRYNASVCVFRPNDLTAYLEVENALAFEVQPAILHNGMWPYGRQHGLVRICDSATLSPA